MKTIITIFFILIGLISMAQCEKKITWVCKNITDMTTREKKQQISNFLTNKNEIIVKSNSPAGELEIIYAIIDCKWNWDAQMTIGKTVYQVQSGQITGTMTFEGSDDGTFITTDLNLKNDKTKYIFKYLVTGTF